MFELQYVRRCFAMLFHNVFGSSAWHGVNRNVNDRIRKVVNETRFWARLRRAPTISLSFSAPAARNSIFLVNTSSWPLSGKVYEKKCMKNEIPKKSVWNSTFHTLKVYERWTMTWTIGWPNLDFPYFSNDIRRNLNFQHQVAALENSRTLFRIEGI